MSQTIPWKKMTLSQQMEAARNRQAKLSLEHDLLRSAQAAGFDDHQVSALIQQSHAAFKFVNGFPVVVGADGKTALRRADGWLLTVEDWIAARLGQVTPG